MKGVYFAFAILFSFYCLFGSIQASVSIQPKQEQTSKQFGIFGEQCPEGDVSIYFYSEVDTMQLIYEIRGFLDHIEQDYSSKIFKDGPSNKSPKRSTKRI